MEIQALLRNYIVKHRMNQQTFAEHIGMSQQGVSKLLKGDCYPSYRTMLLIYKRTKGKLDISKYLRDKRNV